MGEETRFCKFYNFCELLFFFVNFCFSFAIFFVYVFRILQDFKNQCLQRIASERLLKIYMNTSHIFYLDVQSVPGTEEKSEEPGLTREELKEQERLR